MTILLEDGKFTVKTEAGFTTKVTSLPLDGTVVDEEYYGGGKSKVTI